MKIRPDLAAYAVSAAAGALLWISVYLITGRAEAWDSPLYWTFAYPSALILSGLVALVVPQKAWRWGLTMILIQLLPLLLLSDGSAMLLPAGLITLGILSLPPMVAASWIGRLRCRHLGVEPD